MLLQCKNPAGEDQLVFRKDCDNGDIVAYIEGQLCLRQDISANADGSPHDGSYVRYFEDSRVVLDRCEDSRRVISTDVRGPRQVMVIVSGDTLCANHSSFEFTANTYVEDLNRDRPDCLPQFVLRASRSCHAGEQVRYNYSTKYMLAQSFLTPMATAWSAVR